MKAWIKGHKVIVVVIALALGWVVYRVSKGLALVSSGHASPDDAIAYGWVVYQRGITGWLEVSPDGKTSIAHDTGWNGDPYQKG